MMKFTKIESHGNAAVWRCDGAGESPLYGIVEGRNEDPAFEPTWDSTGWFLSIPTWIDTVPVQQR